MSALDPLRKLSARIGADPLLVQAAGGNTSIKQDGVMWIKASGTWLKDAITNDVFVPLDYESLKQALAADDPDCESCTKFVRTDLNPSGLRPSIETSVHGLMPQPVVLHVHCVNTIAWAIQENAEALLAKKLEGENWTFVPYARPGLMLSRAIREKMRPNTNVLVLGNHGLVVAAETVLGAEVLLRKIVQKLSRPARNVLPPDLTGLMEVARGTDYVPATYKQTHALAFDAVAVEVGAENVYYPDHVVFLGTKIPRDFAESAPAVLVRRKGMLIHKDAKPAVEPMLRCLADVFRRVELNAKLTPLSAEQIDQLLNWDAEKYRQALKAN
jgi:rhamnose utilization protein RhaD (predicted bifunctional aldolase and dehydrogenase)